MNPNYEMVKAQISMVMAMAVGTKLHESGLLEKAAEAFTIEKRLAAVREGVELIKAECDLAFKLTPEAQRMKAEVQKSLIKHHYKYFGFEPEEAAV